MNTNFWLLILLLLICHASIAQDKQITTLSKQYQTLRSKQKTLTQGVFDKELSGAGGKLEQVLNELGKQLSATHYTQQDIIRIMGQPDAIKSAGDYQPPSISGHSYQQPSDGIIPKNTLHLIYFWRGWHDYLYFVIKNGKVKAARWYYAGE